MYRLLMPYYNMDHNTGDEERQQERDMNDVTQEGESDAEDNMKLRE